MSISTDATAHPGALAHTLRVSDIVPAPGAAAPGGNNQQVRLSRLAKQDERFGPLRIGELNLSRMQLHAMGATLAGRPLSEQYVRHADQWFIDGLQLDAIKVGQAITASAQAHQQSVPHMLFEIAAQRSIDAPALLSEPEGRDPQSSLHKLGRLLDAVQQLDLRAPPLPDIQPSWVDKAKSRSMTSAGVGMQAYGLYCGITGTFEALKKGDRAEAAINVGGIVAEVGSVTAELGLAKTAQAMIRHGGLVFNGFSATSVAKGLARSAGLLGSALTLPFDLYNAIRSFNDAAAAQGKQAQDHYVSAALSLTSAGLSLALGTGALAGFGAAGPVGIVAGMVLILGARIYGAARQVDDIDDYIELSLGERWRSGWQAFWGMSLDQGILDRYQIAVATDNQVSAQEKAARALLDGELKDSVQTIVTGKFQIELISVKHWKHQWDARRAQTPYRQVNETTLREGNDTVDASDGVPSSTPGVVEGSAGEAKGILWQLGGGDDSIIGVRNKPNYFSYGEGLKTLTGGDKDDLFQFTAAGERLKSTPLLARYHALRGGSGTDTLALLGTPARPSRYIGYSIDLKHGRLGLRTARPHSPATLHTTFDSIENVETLAGASNHVQGTDQANRIVAHGEGDLIEAGAGDDTILLLGNNAQAAGGPGKDHYFVGANSNTATIDEDGQAPSLIEMGWEFGRILRWSVQGTSLVVSSRSDEDGELAEKNITVTHVYKTLGDERRLQNDLLEFITLDGYRLRPDLPARLSGVTPHDLKAVVTTVGRRPSDPIIVTGAQKHVSAEQSPGFFIARYSCAQIVSLAATSTCTLYIDYDSTEIASVEACYTVSSTRQGAFDYLSYGETQLTLTFNDGKRLELLQPYRNRSAVGSNVGGSLVASGLSLNRPFVLVMRDGRSYRLQTPRHSYFDDHREPGLKRVKNLALLRQRQGEYLFVRPRHAPATVLQAHRQRIDIPAEPQVSFYILEGQASSYDLYPRANTSISLTTPGAATQETNASLWNIYPDFLDEPIDRSHISLDRNRLAIGTVNIMLPEDEGSDQPLEKVRVFTRAGNRYDIQYEFGKVLLGEVNARAYADPDAILKDIRQHRQKGELIADLLEIRHIRLKDASTANLYYDTENDDWTVDTDWSRSIRTDELQILAPAL
ncbi:calcium-binding protein [Pseudomonas agarici]|uniref:calcium-binding protein n=1 Tax=Pseudomonas agarici TaxID=46677 RepID=UPI0002F8BA26|nr:calcium-binding protein [Pseudomonas agarici]NWC10514.1 calcium-binding protein [Pseudomonas agarici]SEL40133.1 hypothetical protein SAMN05216604_11745 [Pseudomonas agarici]